MATEGGAVLDAQNAYREKLRQTWAWADQRFAIVLLAQWCGCLLLAVGNDSHQLASTALLGGAAVAPAVAGCLGYPGASINRYLAGVCQVLVSALVSFICHGRMESQFHLFAALTLLAVYRDPRVYVPAATVALLDHGLRGQFLPATLYGDGPADFSRFLEFAAWLGGETLILMALCGMWQRDLLLQAESEHRLQEAAQRLDASVVQRTAELEEKEKVLQTTIGSLSRVIQQVRRSGIQVTGASTSLAASSRQQEASIAEQAAAAAQIWSTSREISATSKELVSTMDGVARTAEETGALASDSSESLSTMQATMAHMVGAAAGIVSKLAVLSEKANKINSVVTTISKVADQTNLLSLNAAIEAEKAGEAGKGFGVVATEIRRLADQTAVATLDIDQVIKEMQSAVSVGVMGMDKFTEEVRRSEAAVSQVAERMSSIMDRVHDMTRRFEDVNYGMKSQAQGATQISESISQIAQAAQHTAGTVKEFTAVVNQLQEATQSLQLIVNEANETDAALGTGAS